MTAMPTSRTVNQRHDVPASPRSAPSGRFVTGDLPNPLPHLDQLRTNRRLRSVKVCKEWPGGHVVERPMGYV